MTTTPESISDTGGEYNVPGGFEIVTQRRSDSLTPTLTLEDIEACMHGFASVEGSSLDLHLYLREDLEIWEEAIKVGYLTLPYEKARSRLALLVLWEMYCWVGRKPTLWLFPSDTNPVLGLNIKTTGHTFGVKGWIALNHLCRSLGLTPNKHSTEGCRSFAGRPSRKTWDAEVTDLILQHCKGRFRDRLNYRITWNTYGNLWRLRTNENVDDISQPLLAGFD